MESTIHFDVFKIGMNKERNKIPLLGSVQKSRPSVDIAVVLSLKALFILSAIRWSSNFSLVNISALLGPSGFGV